MRETEVASSSQTRRKERCDGYHISFTNTPHVDGIPAWSLCILASVCPPQVSISLEPETKETSQWQRRTPRPEEVIGFRDPVKEHLLLQRPQVQFSAPRWWFIAIHKVSIPSSEAHKHQIEIWYQYICMPNTWTHTCTHTHSQYSDTWNK